MDLVNYIQKEWNTLSSAPFTFISFFILSCVGAFIVAKFRFEGVIENLKGTLETLKERMQGKDDQLSTYRERLHLIPRDHTASSTLTDAELKDKTLLLVAQIREFMLRRRRVDDSIHMRPYNPDVTDEDRQREWNLMTQRSSEESLNTHAEYNKRFKTESIILRDELLTRLPATSLKRGGSLNGNNRVERLGMTYEHPTNYFGFEDVAVDLEYLAKALPSKSKAT